jgi:hypothetical protein
MQNTKVCLDKYTLGYCTKGDDCEVCRNEVNAIADAMQGIQINEINLNTNAKTYVPKSKRIENDTNTSINVNMNNNNTNQLNFNLNANEYVPKWDSKNANNIYTNGYQNGNGNHRHEEYDINNNDDDDFEKDEFDMIMKDIIDNEALEEFNEESDDDVDKWFPMYKDCECCKGFVYKCKGPACSDLGKCYCKMQKECDDEYNE